MKWRKNIVLTAVLICFGFSVVLNGCVTASEEQRSTATGGAIGAATGAILGGVIGNQSGHTGTGVVIGALIGGLSGAVIGDYYYKRQKTAQETSQTYGYSSAQGTVVRLEKTAVVPTSVHPGDKINIQCTYAVLAPDNSAAIAVKETQEVRSQSGELVGKPEVQVNREAGTYSDSLPIILPKDAKKGTYKVTTTIEAGNSKDTREASFQVL